MSDVLARGWGYVLDIRRDPIEGHQALTQFANEEAPHWVSYCALALHRRQLIDIKRSQPQSG
jgi:hypothetical protein